jgi:hypothetical protein
MIEANERFALKPNDGYASVDAITESESFSVRMINRQPEKQNRLP